MRYLIAFFRELNINPRECNAELLQTITDLLIKKV